MDVLRRGVDRARLLPRLASAPHRDGGGAGDAVAAGWPCTAFIAPPTAPRRAGRRRSRTTPRASSSSTRCSRSRCASSPAGRRTRPYWIVIALTLTWLALLLTARADADDEAERAHASGRFPYRLESIVLLAVAAYLFLPVHLFKPVDLWMIGGRFLTIVALCGALVAARPDRGQPALAVGAGDRAVDVLPAGAGAHVACSFDRRAASFRRLMRHVERGSSTLVLVMGDGGDPAVDPTALPYLQFHAYAQYLAGGFDAWSLPAGFPCTTKPGAGAAGAALEASRDLHVRPARRPLRLHPDQGRVDRPRPLRPRRQRARAAGRAGRRLAALRGRAAVTAARARSRSLAGRGVRRVGAGDGAADLDREVPAAPRPAEPPRRRRRLALPRRSEVGLRALLRSQPRAAAVLGALLHGPSSHLRHALGRGGQQDLLDRRTRWRCRRARGRWRGASGAARGWRCSRFRWCGTSTSATASSPIAPASRRCRSRSSSSIATRPRRRGGARSPSRPSARSTYFFHLLAYALFLVCAGSSCWRSGAPGRRSCWRRARCRCLSCAGIGAWALQHANSMNFHRVTGVGRDLIYDPRRRAVGADPRSADQLLARARRRAGGDRRRRLLAGARGHRRRAPRCAATTATSARSRRTCGASSSASSARWRSISCRRARCSGRSIGT